MSHLRATASLFLLTLLICCALYPAALWLVGAAVLPTRAGGSLLVEGEARGSRLIAQPFAQAKYFRPRPSAIDYRADASGGSNLAVSNPLLRDRVAREVGRVARFQNGDRVGPVVQAWFLANPGTLGRWADENPTLAKRWYGGEDEKQAVASLKRFADMQPLAWPAVNKGEDGDVSLDVVSVGEEDVTDLQCVLFDYWLSAHADRGAEIERVPADLVLASGSGLDPHITLRAAKYQLPDVAAARAAEAGLSRDVARQRVEALVEKHAARPLLLLGEPLLNVLELNAALDEEFAKR